MRSYLDECEETSDDLAELSDRIDKVLVEAGIAKVVGGAAGAASGLAVIGGIILAPFSGGLSLGLTAAGVVVGLAGTATTLTAEAVKEGHIQDVGSKAKEEVAGLERKDEAVYKLLEDIQANLAQLQAFDEKGVGQWIKEAGQLARKGKVIATKSYVLANAARHHQFAAKVMNFISTGVAYRGSSVGSFSQASKFLQGALRAGKTTAKICAKAFAVLGIAMGVWDIVEGARDIQIKESPSQGYREAALKLRFKVWSIDHIMRLDLGLEIHLCRVKGLGFMGFRV